jgi:hypothetical protein
MGLFDGYLDPGQFQASGGLLGRLLSLPQMQGLYQPSMDSDPQVSADKGQAAGAQMSVPLSMPRPILQANGPAVNPQTPVYWPTQAAPMGDYQMPQFGRVDVSQAVQQPPDPGDRLSAGLQSWAHTPVGNPVAGLANGITGQSYGRRTDAGGNASDADPSGNGRAGGSREASSIAGKQPPDLSKIGYFEIPTNPNQAAGELLGIQERNEKHTISRKDHVSGVREGNVKQKDDGSLEVTNGTVVTLSYKDGRAKTVTVTGEDIAYIDAKTGEVVIQKSF